MYRLLVYTTWTLYSSITGIFMKSISMCVPFLFICPSPDEAYAPSKNLWKSISMLSQVLSSAFYDSYIFMTDYCLRIDTLGTAAHRRPFPVFRIPDPTRLKLHPLRRCSPLGSQPSQSPRQRRWQTENL